MKLLIITTTIALAMLLSDSALATDLGRPDRQKHMIVSAFIGLSSYGTLRHCGASKGAAFMGALATVFIVGSFKEVGLDPVYDDQDIAANMVGGSLGIMVPFVIEF